MIFCLYTFSLSCSLMPRQSFCFDYLHVKLIFCLLLIIRLLYVRWCVGRLIDIIVHDPLGFIIISCVFFRLLSAVISSYTPQTLLYTHDSRTYNVKMLRREKNVLYCREREIEKKRGKRWKWWWWSTIYYFTLINFDFSFQDHSKVI